MNAPGCGPTTAQAGTRRRHRRLRRLRAALPPAGAGSRAGLDRRQGRPADQGESRPRTGRGRDHHVDRSGPQRPGARPDRPDEIRAVWVGSESHPYAVKPTSTVVAEAIGAVPNTQAADWEFACKAGTEAVQAAIGFVGSGMADYAWRSAWTPPRAGRATRSNTPPAPAARPSCSARPRNSLAIFEASYSYVTDTPDFWRRADEKYPEHGERFTGEPAYFKHITEAGAALMETLGRRTARLQLRGLPPAEHQVPAAGGQVAGVQAGADRDRAAGRRDRQHLRRLGADRPDGHPGCGASPAIAFCWSRSARAPARMPSAWWHRAPAAAARTGPVDPRLHRPPDRDRLRHLRPLPRQAHVVLRSSRQASDRGAGLTDRSGCPICDRPRRRHDAGRRALGDLAARAGAGGHCTRRMADAGGLQPQALYVANMLAPALSGQSHLGALLADFAGLRGIEAIDGRGRRCFGRPGPAPGLPGARGGSVRHGAGRRRREGDRPSRQRLDAALSAWSDADYEAVHGLTATAQAALVMRRYLHEHGAPADALAGFSLTAHRNAVGNAERHVPQGDHPAKTTGGRAWSAIRSTCTMPPRWPTARLPFCSAVRPSPASRSGRPRPHPGNGQRHRPPGAARSDPTRLSLPAAAISAERALQSAGITRDDIDLSSCTTRFTIYAALALEAAGFAARGQGWQLARNGTIALEGKLP